MDDRRLTMSPHEEKVTSKKGMKLLKRRNTLTTLLGIYARRDSLQDCNIYTLLNFSTDSPVEDTTYPLNLSMISSQGKFEDKTIFDV